METFEDIFLYMLIAMISVVSRGIEGTISKIIFFPILLLQLFWSKVSKTTFLTTIFKIVIFQQFLRLFSKTAKARQEKQLIFERVPSIPLDRHPTCLQQNNFEILIFNGDFQIFRPHVQGVKCHRSPNSKFSPAFIHKTAPKNVW